jgi:hypothetical protein
MILLMIFQGGVEPHSEIRIRIMSKSRKKKPTIVAC